MEEEVEECVPAIPADADHPAKNEHNYRLQVRPFTERGQSVSSLALRRFKGKSNIHLCLKMTNSIWKHYGLYIDKILSHKATLMQV